MKEPERGDVFLEWEEVGLVFSHHVGRSLGLDDLQSRHWERLWTSTAVTCELDSFFELKSFLMFSKIYTRARSLKQRSSKQAPTRSLHM